jgi:hypothetical protein
MQKKVLAIAQYTSQLYSNNVIEIVFIYNLYMLLLLHAVWHYIAYQSYVCYLLTLVLSMCKCWIALEQIILHSMIDRAGANKFQSIASQPTTIYNKVLYFSNKLLSLYYNLN